jgi:hypothetical protein
MRVSALAFAGLCAASPALVARKQGRVDVSGSYWDVTISVQSGRPGYTIRDLTTSFHNPKFEQTVEGKCHYSFVPQGTSPPAETDQCDKGLQYTWDCTSSLLISFFLPQKMDGEAKICGQDVNLTLRQILPLRCAKMLLLETRRSQFLEMRRLKHHAGVMV